jgi:hypothetical protein
MSATTSNPLPPLLAAVDEVVTSWPDIHGKNVFGHRGWVRAGTMLAFIAGEGVAIKALSETHAAELYARPGVGPFVYSGAMEMRGWPVLPVATDEDVCDVLSELQRVYEAVAG